MSDIEHLDRELKENLKDYKTSAAPQMKLALHWDKDLIFSARTARGYVIDYDAKVEWGCMPTESLLASTAGCLAIDVVSFLVKMRCEIKSFVMDVTGTRNPYPPQYFTGIEIAIDIRGKGITEAKMNRVIALSKEKYCSVYHTLRKDLNYAVNYKITQE